jgi:hypothetical protein
MTVPRHATEILEETSRDPGFAALAQGAGS